MLFTLPQSTVATEDRKREKQNKKKEKTNKKNNTGYSQRPWAAIRTMWTRMQRPPRCTGVNLSIAMNYMTWVFVGLWLDLLLKCRIVHCLDFSPGWERLTDTEYLHENKPSYVSK